MIGTDHTLSLTSTSSSALETERLLLNPSIEQRTPHALLLRSIRKGESCLIGFRIVNNLEDGYSTPQKANLSLIRTRADALGSPTFLKRGLASACIAVLRCIGIIDGLGCFKSVEQTMQAT